VRWIGFLVAFCLLFAGVARERADHERARPHDEIAAVKALAQLAARRHDGARPLVSIGLDACTPVPLETLREPPRGCVEIVHATPARRHVARASAYDARGPPVG
jgi:hypothetical protein